MDHKRLEPGIWGRTSSGCLNHGLPRTVAEKLQGLRG